eukprot:Tbor_TRINITY_DN5817_c1_g3::TRINITY_DN5817_c1_g3_i1::g.6643::m.6643
MSFVGVLAQPQRQSVGDIEESQWQEDDSTDSQVINTDPRGIVVINTGEVPVDPIYIEESKKSFDAYIRDRSSKMVEKLASERKKFISPMFKVNCLFTEAANWEIQRIKKNISINDDEKKLLIQDVTQSYKSLIADVEDVIRARLPAGVDKEETITDEAMKSDYRYQHRSREELKAALMAIADEAISFHSTVLPFSDGIICKERLPISQETMLKARHWIEEGVSGSFYSEDYLDEESGWFNYNNRGKRGGNNTIIISVAASTPISQAKKSRVLAKRIEVLERVRKSGKLFIGDA